MLITGYDVPPIHHAAIVVEGNKIVAAGRASEITIPADAAIVDTSGRVMLPGSSRPMALSSFRPGQLRHWFPWITQHGGDAMLKRVMEISARQR